MIVKKIGNRKTTRTKARQIGDLLDYIRNPQDHPEKVEHSGGRNFLTATHEGQKAEMITLAQESAHSAMPVQHWLLSWREGEEPTHGQVEEAVDMFLEGMGLGDHQAVYALHGDTDNRHLHIAVNRMSERLGMVVRPNGGFDIRAAHQAIARIEHRQGWIGEKNAGYAVLENGEVARVRRGRKEREPDQGAVRHELATGEKSAQRIARERGHAIIAGASSWEDLHRGLAEAGLRLEKKGSGAIIFVGEFAVKASSVDRAFSLSKLCKRLGDFEPGSYPEAAEPVAPEPVSSVNAEEWRRYQEERREAEGKETQPPRPDARRTLDGFRDRCREMRARALGMLAKYGISILNIARHCLKLQHARELRKLRARLADLVARRPRMPQFEHWLRRLGMAGKADTWRYRAHFEGAGKQDAEGSSAGRDAASVAQEAKFNLYSRAVGADRYRVTCIRMGEDGGRQAFILDKRDGETRGFTPEEMRRRMDEMLRIQARGENIYYTPLSDGRHHLLIDDMTEESVRRLYADGFRPAVLLRSSPGSFQCVLTIPKLGTEFDREVGNRLTERLNREYGDRKLSGCIHPHRAPGFENRKPKHRREDGTFPEVELLQARRRECPRALELSRRLDAEIAERTRLHRRMVRERGSGSAVRSIPGSPAEAYRKHLDDIRRHIAVEDLSRADSMIALRMRATGHSEEAVRQAVRECAPDLRGQDVRRDWDRYAERTAAYAFGVAGDVDLMRHRGLIPHWRRVEAPEPPRADVERGRDASPVLVMPAGERRQEEEAARTAPESGLAATPAADAEAPASAEDRDGRERGNEPGRRRRRRLR